MIAAAPAATYGYGVPGAGMPGMAPGMPQQAMPGVGMQPQMGMPQQPPMMGGGGAPGYGGFGM